MESNNLDQLAMDAINEYIDLAEKAIETPRKNDANNNSCHGCAAVVLLASVLDAIGSYYNCDSQKGVFVSYDREPNLDKRGKVGEHFDQVYKQFQNIINNYGYIGNNSFKKDFYIVFRNKLVHNAVFAKGKLVMHNSTDVTKNILNVNDLLEMVKKVKDKFYNDHLDVFAVGETVEGPITGKTGTTALTSTQANAGSSKN